MEQDNQLVNNISVVIPVYNHAAWVIPAIQSVLAQSLPPKELIIIDDASTDNSWQLILDYCNALSVSNTLIRLERHVANQGAPATLNQGLRLATGEYIAILNSDDYWQPQRLARLSHLATTEKLDFIFTDVNLIDAQGQANEVNESHWADYFASLKQAFLQQQDIVATLLRGNVAISTSNFFFHRRIYEVIGDFADLRYVHDYHYLLRVLLSQFTIRFLIGEKLLDYRLHGSNTIREKPHAAIAENMRMLLDLLPHLNSLFNAERLLGLRHQLQELYRYTEEEWLSAIHWRLVAKEKELFTLIQDRNKWIAERDTWIKERDSCIAEQVYNLAQLTTANQTLIRQVEEQAQRLVEYQQDQEQLQHSLAQHIQWLAERDSWIADRDRWISERELWIKERDSLIQQLQQTIQVLQQSRAFRLGNQLLTPLRTVKQWSKTVEELA